MVLVEPPAPAARVLEGLALAIFSFWSAAARLRMAVRGPPGGVGDPGRPVLAPLETPGALPTGDEGRGEDYSSFQSDQYQERKAEEKKARHVQLDSQSRAT